MRAERNNREAALPALSVVIPCLNEAARLPLLLADLQRYTPIPELLVVDGASGDRSAEVAELAGARVLPSVPACRGRQLATGARQASNSWLLFLHADSRLPRQWPEAVADAMRAADAATNAWYFPLTIEPSTAARRVLERLVNLRSRVVQTPYGDQGLLIHRHLYDASGGFEDLPLMEDLDLVQRVGQRAALRPLSCCIQTDGRRWERDGVLGRSWRNARLRQRWRQGASAQSLAAAYDGSPPPLLQLAYQKPQR